MPDVIHSINHLAMAFNGIQIPSRATDKASDLRISDQISHQLT